MALSQPGQGKARPDAVTEEEKRSLTPQEQANLKAALSECYGWGTHSKDRVLSSFADDAVYHDMTMEAARGIKEIDKFAAAWFGAFPAFEVTIEQTVVRGDTVVFQGQFGGWNRGEVYGQPATNKYFVTPYVQIVGLRDGKIVSVQDYWDKGQLYRQLGVPIEATWA